MTSTGVEADTKVAAGRVSTASLLLKQVGSSRGIKQITVFGDDMKRGDTASLIALSVTP